MKQIKGIIEGNELAYGRLKLGGSLCPGGCESPDACGSGGKFGGGGGRRSEVDRD